MVNPPIINQNIVVSVHFFLRIAQRIMLFVYFVELHVFQILTFNLANTKRIGRVVTFKNGD